MDNLVIYQKIYDFTLYLFPVVDKFPKYEKFILCTHVKSCVLDIAREVIRANKSRNKKPILYDIDVRIEELKFLLRLAHDRKSPEGKGFLLGILRASSLQMCIWTSLIIL